MFAASIRTSVTRPSDLGARFGGDEFAVLLPDTSLEDAAALAERIRADLMVHRNAGDVRHGVVRLSIGVACLAPGMGGKHPDLVAAAPQRHGAVLRRGHLTAAAL